MKLRNIGIILKMWWTSLTDSSSCLPPLLFMAFSKKVWPSSSAIVLFLFWNALNKTGKTFKRTLPEVDDVWKSENILNWLLYTLNQTCQLATNVFFARYQEEDYSYRVGHCANEKAIKVLKIHFDPRNKCKRKETSQINKPIEPE